MTIDNEAYYFEQNRQRWNDSVAVHLESDFYNQSAFLAGQNTLKSIEIDFLGREAAGKSLLHLQCHFGQDTLSWARLGAKVTGADFSETAIETARQTAQTLGIDARFVCANVYDLPQILNETYDIVFTSYGVIGWLPDMERWAAVIAPLLKPGGLFFMAEFHPVVWTFDDDFNEIKYSYFNREIIETETEGTYANRNAPLKSKEYGWNHHLGEVLGALLAQGLHLEHFAEYDYSPFACFPNLTEDRPGQFVFKKFGRKLPMVYSCAFRKA